MLKFREPGLSVLQNAQHIISTYEKFEPSLEKWIEYLCEHIFESVNLSFMSDLKKESLFSTFHNLCTEKRHERYFLSTMEKCGIEVNKLTNFFYNQLMDAMLNSMLKYGNRKLIPIFTRPQNVELEKSEVADNDFDSSLEEYTNAWVDLVNRGGLHHVSDEFYLFIKAVEMEARTIIAVQIFLRYYIIRSQRVKILKYAGITLLGI